MNVEEPFFAFIFLDNVHAYQLDPHGEKHFKPYWKSVNNLKLSSDTNPTEYFNLYNNPYTWNISKQLHDFTFNACIFIGISLTDPNMKRLLELSKNPLKFNFIFLKKEKDYKESVFKDLTNYYFTYDLIPIWVNEFNEIGDYLNRI